MLLSQYNVPNIVTQCVGRSVFFNDFILNYGRALHQLHPMTLPNTHSEPVAYREGGFGVFKPPRNSEDIGGVLDRISNKNRRLDFLL